MTDSFIKTEDMDDITKAHSNIKNYKTELQKFNNNHIDENLLKLVQKQLKSDSYSINDTRQLLVNANFVVPKKVSNAYLYDQLIGKIPLVKKDIFKTLIKYIVMH